jgi:hypothetical protein
MQALHRNLAKWLNPLSKLGATSLLIAGATLSTCLVGVAEKAEAQTSPNFNVHSFLTSGSGRWVETGNPDPFICATVYDFKPSGVLGYMRVTRQNFALNLISGQCFTPLPTSFGAVGQVTTDNILTVQFPSGFTERIQLIQFDDRTQQMLVGRGFGNGILQQIWQR